MQGAGQAEERREACDKYLHAVPGATNPGDSGVPHGDKSLSGKSIGRHLHPQLLMVLYQLLVGCCQHLGPSISGVVDDYVRQILHTHDQLSKPPPPMGLTCLFCFR